MSLAIGAQPLDLVLLAIGLITGCATALGGAAALALKERIHLVLGFSAGAVIGVALLDLMPEALSLAGPKGGFSTAAILAGGFCAYLLADRMLVAFAGRGGAGEEHAHRGHMGPASLTAHSFLDGLGIGFGFQVSPKVGIVLALAVIAHDFADGVNTVNLSLIGPRKWARAWLAADAIAPLVGIGASLLVAPPATVLGVIIALFSGFFLYIGASELLPESHHRFPGAWTTLTTLTGAGIIFVIIVLAP
ncbi:MAG: ZIP family metal transporter [Caulobacteraceae bacterium]